MSSGYGSSGWGVTIGGGSGGSNNRNNVQYVGDSAGYQNGPLSALFMSLLSDYKNSGAMSDLLRYGKGFGQSRRFGDLAPTLAQLGQGGAPPASAAATGAKKATVPGGLESNVVGSGSPGGGTGGLPWSGWDPTGEDTGWAPDEGPAGGGGGGGRGGYGGGGGRGGYGGGGGNGDGSQGGPNGPRQQQNWGVQTDWDQWTNSPTGEDGLLGEVNRLGRGNDIDERLRNDLGWQATGDLMDLEGRGLEGYEDYGKQNWNEAATDSMANWFRGGELSSLEQQGKHGYLNYGNATGLENEVGNSWRGVAGPGEYDPLRGKTLTGLVDSKGFSTDERGKMMASSLLPIQQALEAQKLEGDARQAATGNAAGRWGASNAMALNAAGQASQAARDIDLASANMARQERAQGLEGLSGLQNQIDQRKAAGASGLQGLSGQQRAAQLASVQGLNSVAQNQRQNQLAGMNTAMQSNAQQRAAQLASTQGIGQMGQNQRANTQWGLQNLGAFNEQQKQNQFAGYGARNDFTKDVENKGQQGAQLAGQLGSLVSGGNASGSATGFNAGISI